jgi:hypothetical protein
MVTTGLTAAAAGKVVGEVAGVVEVPPLRGAGIRCLARPTRLLKAGEGGSATTEVTGATEEMEYSVRAEQRVTAATQAKEAEEERQ